MKFIFLVKLEENMYIILLYIFHYSKETMQDYRKKAVSMCQHQA